MRRLARLYDVQATYYDVDHRRRAAEPEALLAVLRALGAPVEGSRDVADALRERRQSLWRRPIEPVIVAWEGRPAEVEVRLPASRAGQPLRCALHFEDGGSRSWVAEPVPSAAGETEVEGVTYAALRLPLPDALPTGYHRLTMRAAGRAAGVSGEAMVISAPVRAYGPDRAGRAREWGVFSPTYALHSRRSWGAGDLSDLGALMRWVTGLGGRVVGTLPLLPAFLDRPFEPSPYAPVSRLFWNEFYVDVEAVPELERCPPARARVASPGFRAEVEELRSAPLVDYRRQMALKRGVLEEMARCFFGEESARHAEFRRFVEERPELEAYARFRAACERRREPWRSWPARLRDGDLADGDYDEDARRYHLYVQWLAEEQVRALANGPAGEGARLYLDLPLGVHPDGYDVWRERRAFAEGVSAGAPPDLFFSRGQDWGFRPLHPEGLREQGYRYLIASLRHHLRHAGVLRVDHAMGLHRLYWIPNGLPAPLGVYVRYRSEELYAILSVESHRNRAFIAGEDLGTVPTYVGSAMGRHNIMHSYVVPFELRPDAREPLGRPPRGSVASLNTHDMPTFAAFWGGHDIDDRMDLGLVDRREAGEERRERRTLKRALASSLGGRGRLMGRSAGAREVLQASLGFLAGSDARLVLVSLEDLWLETQPHNVPGTSEQRPNWRRKARHGIEELPLVPRVVDTLKEVDRGRRGKVGAA